MTDWRETSDAAFEAGFSAWIAEHYPADWRHSTVRPFHRLRGEQATYWLRLLQTGGWRAPAWPREHGGMGLGFARQRLYRAVLEQHHVARVLDFGEQMLGPIIMTFGTSEQKRTLLPRILSCDDIWCQGYSEPNAGSDLASLRMTAVEDGDAFIVNGQKIWTTHAQESTHMFALVRTTRGERKQDGISFLLIDLQLPGIRVRPIANIAGEEEYCEVFCDDVRVPVANLIGGRDQGWTIAKALLGHERIWVGSPDMARRALALARIIVTALGLWQDFAVADQFAALATDVHDLEALYGSICDAVEREGAPGPQVGMLKILATELQQRICDFNAAIASDHAGVVGEDRIGSLPVDLHWQLMMARPVTIFGGASEVQRDILARSVLGLQSR
jgi:alkylation response protein AidB-like acyl-CoA dehydrogenase